MNPVSSFWTRLDYDHVLPGIAQLPLPLGSRLSALRGSIYAGLSRDWRIFSQLDADVDLRVRMAIERMLPHGTALERARLRRLRYRAQSQAEWAAELLAAGRLPPPSHPPAPQTGPIIYITAHFGASIEAASMLGGSRPPLLMTSSVIERPGIPLAIRQHYQRKYAALRHCHAETGLAPFVRELREGGSIIILADLPGDATNHTQASTPWGLARLAAGPRRLAERTGAALTPYTASLGHGSSLEIHIGEPTYPDDQRDWHQPAYTALFDRLKDKPEQWWAMDLLPLWAC